MAETPNMKTMSLRMSLQFGKVPSHLRFSEQASDVGKVSIVFLLLCHEASETEKSKVFLKVHGEPVRNQS